MNFVEVRDLSKRVSKILWYQGALILNGWVSRRVIEERSGSGSFDMIQVTVPPKNAKNVTTILQTKHATCRTCETMII